MHPGLTTSKMQAWPPESQALLRAALNGTFFTADRLAKRDPSQSSLCRFCQAEDSQMHRHWLCPYFAACRDHMTPQQVEMVLSLPSVIGNHGWIPTPPSVHPFRQACLATPDETLLFAWPTHVSQTSHALTRPVRCINLQAGG